jgi:RHS repeat-associated protein
VTSIDRTGKPDLALTWNGQYQLTSVSTNGVVAESYAYDPLGRRASTTSGGVTFRHVYDGVHCAADIDSAGAVVRSYTWGPGVDNLLAVTCHSGSSSTTYYALTDVQGTVYGFADANGDLVARYAYDAWGNLLDADVAVSDLADNRYLFQGREYSHATGLYNFRLRWYDPATGRWLSKDPIGISGGLNLYAFCGNDPVNYMDPWGLFWREAGSVALGTFSGAVSGAATGATSGATIGAIIGGTTGSVVFPGVGTGVGVGGGAVVGAGGGAIMGAVSGALGGFVASLGAALADGDLGDVAEAGASAGALSGIGAGAGAIGGVAAGAFGGAIAGGISGGIASEGYLNTILYCGAVGGVWSGIGGGSPGMYPAFFSATGEIWGYDLCWLIELYDNDCE